jgi:hypothetical protein
MEPTRAPRVGQPCVPMERRCLAESRASAAQGSSRSRSGPVVLAALGALEPDWAAPSVIVGAAAAAPIRHYATAISVVLAPEPDSGSASAVESFHALPRGARGGGRVVPAVTLALYCHPPWFGGLFDEDRPTTCRGLDGETRPVLREAQKVGWPRPS